MADNIANGLLGRTRGNEGAGNGKTEEVEAENPYGCNQHGHGWVDACPYGGGGSNGLAGKSALQIAGGAENVNPDDDEEKKKKKEAEAKAAAEAKAKEEAKQVVAEADEREKKWAELSDFYKKKLEEMSALKGTKEYEKAQDALKTIDWYKGGFAHWKEKLANGTEYERAAALDSLRRISNAERDAAQMQAYEKKAKTAFNKLEKFMKTFSDKKEAPVKKGTQERETKDINSAQKKLSEAANDMREAVRTMNPGAVYDAQKKMHKAAELWAAAERRAKGDEQYFADNNDPSKVLPGRLAEKIAQYPSKLNANAKKRFASFVAKCEPVMEIDGEALEHILQERGNRFVNCFEKAGVCSGSKPRYMKYRDDAEDILFGVDKGMVSTTRPVYAYLRRNIEETIRRSSEYGDTCVTFKKEVRGRCTITGNDSLNYYDLDDRFETGSLLSKPQEGNCLLPWQIDELNSGIKVEDVYNLTPYMEAQIYGPLTANDIQSIGVPFSNYGAWEKANAYAELLRRYNERVRITKKDNHYLVEVE